MASSSLSSGDSAALRSRGQAALQRALDSIPTLLVLGLLAGVLYIGHHTGWKLPKFAALLGYSDGDTKKKDDWCDEHLVPESQCVECRTDLFPKGKAFGWCKIHGVAECPTCHPELYQGKGEPRLPQYDVAAALGLLPRPENNSKSDLHTARLQFVSAESVAKAGVDVAVVEEQPMEDILSANGEITFDPTHVAHLSSRASGTVAQVLTKIGDRVQGGAVLALVDAAAVGQAKAQLFQAVSKLHLSQKNLARLRTVADGIGRKQMQDAEGAQQEAEIACVTARQALVNLGFDLPAGVEKRDPHELIDELRFLGLPADLAATLEAQTKTSNLIPIIAPQAGVVVDMEVVAGEVIDTTTVLFTVAEPAQMWLTLHVPQEQARYLQRGLRVEFTTDDSAQQATGAIEWISPAVEAKSRTLQARVPLENREGKLRDQTFGSARVVLRQEPKAVVVPREAVHSTGDTHLVFVRDKHYFDAQAPKLFHVRQVRLGAKSETHIEILAGALPGEVVASKGSAVLLAQLLRSQLGAGCGCHE